MNIYVEELGRELTPFQWGVWNGRGLHPNLCEYYRKKWISEAKAQPVPVVESSPVVVEVKASTSLPVRPNRCEFLNKRTGFKSGCNGWMCKHDCEIMVILQPAIPGGTCQTCDTYVDSGEKF